MAQIFHGESSRFPTAKTIAGIAPPQTKIGTAQHVGVEADNAHKQSERDGNPGRAPQPDTGSDAVAPEAGRKQTKTEKSERIPIGRCHLVNRKQKVENE